MKRGRGQRVGGGGDRGGERSPPLLSPQVGYVVHIPYLLYLLYKGSPGSSFIYSVARGVTFP